ncbi:peptidoglycan/LPS O-acetylase OafA/YrhL [Larkinella arboricola]|uniref:Peptidoglycan/LPS O-acetylase OafA/YrhL n=1 Tax=Larkinella arboricola TaxID=643671 RepID=A0A327WKH1_LARAB|nr:peptidoglycan/LPS O-acetylase OafA/YrhL [Larkinella arboricola]
MMVSKPAGYLPQLDALRAFAVTLVLIYHWFPQDALINKTPNGAIGVTLFFVLSGFLITQILIQNRNQMLAGQTTPSAIYRNFIVRRALRIFPVYYLFLTFVYFVLPDKSDISNSPAYYYLYAYNILLHQTDNWADLLSPFWTLSVEEQFYLVWPFVVLLTPRLQLRRVIIFTIFLGLATRIWWGLTSHSQGILTLTCLDSFGIGALWSYILVEQPEKIPTFRRQLRWATLLALVCFLFILTQPHTSSLRLFQRIILSILSLYLVAQSTIGFGGITGRVLTNPALIYMGKISYGIYVYHMIVSTYLTGLILNKLSRFSPISLHNFWIHLVSSFLLLIILASLSWFLIEKPITNLKRYFTYSKSSL